MITNATVTGCLHYLLQEESIQYYEGHSSHSLFSYLSSGKRLQIIRAQTSFYPQALSQTTEQWL